MKNIWKTIAVVVLVIVVVGAICAGVGLVTGADVSRIYKIVDRQYGVTQIIEAYQQQLQTILNNATALLQ